MSFERYPEDVKITKEDFINCGWKDILADIKEKDHISMWQAFSDAARKSMDEGQNSNAKIFWLLTDVCSMMLVPESSNQPFKPFIVMEGKRGPIPEDFSNEDIELFSQIVDEIDDYGLKARIADLIWIRKNPRDPKYAYMAIENYRCIPLNKDIWFSYGQECWERAIVLAYMFQRGSKNYIGDIEKALITAFESTTSEDGNFSLQLANLLLFKRLGRDRGSQIAYKLESLANEFKGNGKFFQSKDFFDSSAKWFNFVGDDTKSIEMIIGAAESLVSQAEARINSGTPSHMAAVSFYEDAIQVYRTIPKSKRPYYKVDEKISELRNLMNISGEKSVDEMMEISTEPINLNDVAKNARNSVHDKKAMDALIGFVNSYPGLRFSELHENAIENIKKFPLSSLFQRTIVTSDGRIINKRSGLSLSDPLSDDDEIVILSEMVRNSRINFGICVQGHILPALEILVLEHRLREADFIYIAGNSPIVPTGRESLFGKALFAGYDYDFVTAIHLLVPQIENMVRFHLKSAGIKTTTLSSEGIETENGLSTLIEIPECKKIFGENIAFEIKALFCDASGPNLRNEIAHGLLNYDECQSVYSIYAWWFALKLVLNTFWNSLQGTGEKKEAETSESQDENV